MRLQPSNLALLDQLVAEKRIINLNPIPALTLASLVLEGPDDKISCEWHLS